MTKGQKLIIAGVLLLLIVGAVVILLRRDEAPRLAAVFLRYEEGGDMAVLQITNLTGSRVIYSCFANLDAASPNPAVASWSASVTGVVKAHHHEEVAIKFAAKQRPSKVRLHYLPMDTRYLLNRRLGIGQEA